MGYCIDCRYSETRCENHCAWPCNSPLNIGHNFLTGEIIKHPCAKFNSNGECLSFVHDYAQGVYAVVDFDENVVTVKTKFRGDFDSVFYKIKKLTDEPADEDEEADYGDNESTPSNTDDFELTIRPNESDEAALDDDIAGSEESEPVINTVVQDLDDFQIYTHPIDISDIDKAVITFVVRHINKAGDFSYNVTDVNIERPEEDSPSDDESEIEDVIDDSSDSENT